MPSNGGSRKPSKQDARGKHKPRNNRRFRKKPEDVIHVIAPRPADEPDAVSFKDKQRKPLKKRRPTPIRT